MSTVPTLGLRSAADLVTVLPYLLATVASGDPGAMRVLYDRHAPWLWARLTRRCTLWTGQLPSP